MFSPSYISVSLCTSSIVPAKYSSAVTTSPIREVSTNPRNKILLLGWLGTVDSPSSGNNFEKNDTETVHIGFGRELSRLGVLRRAIAVCTHHPRRNMVLLACWAQPGEPEIRELGVEFAVQ
ncbi:D,D-heptose 1,7-bisphosphate phosphatase [Striga asiatica]|uniref:D,D-heptose 1,7-bisphosphate phosphatase n=1 Tax=Striga asiatica TaxID=4170 RepID=A0A5A7RGH0_STRAF|nr:D,D-heptose 1,7-bisphosphate phosphatase [Striga asiatica]